MAACLQIRFRARKTESEAFRFGSHESFGAQFLRRPRVLANKKVAEISKEEEEGNGERIRDSEGTEEEGVDWEEQILQDTAPLVGFVRMLLHSERYAFEGRLIPEHEKVILDKLLPYHPKLEEKIGCGIDYIRKLASDIVSKLVYGLHSASQKRKR